MASLSPACRFIAPSAKSTGFGGTTQVALSAPGAVDGQIGVRFDANIEPSMPWKFAPAQNTIRIHPGARTTIFYEATNLVARPTTGRAIFNVSPSQAGQYFSKIECFCFTEQTLKAGENGQDAGGVLRRSRRSAPTETTKDIDEITLSYTFYPVENPAAAR